MNRRFPIFGLLDMEYYLAANEDVGRLNINPIRHFLRHGIKELRAPNRFIDLQYGVSKLKVAPEEIISIPSLTNAAIDPSLFDVEYYKNTYKEELDNYKYSALAHYLENSNLKDLKTSPNTFFVNSSGFSRIQKISYPYAPLISTPQAHEEGRPLLIAVPVYKGIETTMKCMESIFNSDLACNTRVLVLNDNSPEPGMDKMLLDFCKDKGFAYRKNIENLGFVKTINLACAERSTGEDMLILNSDTEVPKGFAPEMVRHLEMDRKTIGTVTPMSNNATICTIPVISDGIGIFDEISVSALDQATKRAASLDPDKIIEIPTGIGFAMLINGNLLDALNEDLFDFDSFGAGYGEEVDFCQRTRKDGWINVVCQNTCVYHKGGESFGEEKEIRIKNASKIISSKYPSYDSDVKEWCARDPLALLRIAALAYLAQTRSIQSTIVIQHSLGGGTQKFINELTEKSHRMIYLSIHKPSHGIHRISICAQDYKFNLDIPHTSNPYTFSINLFNPSRIEIHSLIDCDSGQLYEAIRTSDAELVVYIHDLTYACPRKYMMDSNYRFCGAPLSISECARCLELHGLSKNIAAYRSHNELFLKSAHRVICPSSESLRLMKQYYPSLNYCIQAHENTETLELKRLEALFTRNQVDADKDVSILILGYLTGHKGCYQLERIIAHWKNSDHSYNNKINWVLVGKCTINKRDFYHLENFLTETGEYDFGEANKLISLYPKSIIFFPGLVPETYSYTLSEAIASGMPILAPEVGAYPERLHGLDYAWLYDIKLSPKQVGERLKEVIRMAFQQQ